MIHIFIAKRFVHLPLLTIILLIVIVSTQLCHAIDTQSKTGGKHSLQYDKVDFVDYVNILGGTNSAYDFSHGSTLPLITRPWAFNNYAPITNMDDSLSSSWWFHPSDRRFYGIRVTHQPSPWIGDYGNFIIKASIPSINSYENFGDYSGYLPSSSIFKPYLFETSLLAYATTESYMKISFTSTNHGGIMRIIFPSLDKSCANTGYVQVRRVSVELNGGNDTASISTSLIPGVITISGKSLSNHGGVSDNFAHYFVIAIYHGPENSVKPATHFMDSYTSNVGARIDFSPQDPLNDHITLRFATSLISMEQAIINLNREVDSGISFDEMVEDSRKEWNSLLSRVAIEEVGQDYSIPEQKNLLTIFYSSLYRASLFPRVLSEHDSTGKEIHWSPYDGKVHDGPLSADSGFWDAFHTVYPLHSIINQNQLSIMIQGWLNAYMEGKWLPKWSSPGYRSGMVGTMGDVSIADAIVNSISGFNKTLAYEAIRKDAFVIPSRDESGVGRECLESYMKNGYITKISDCDQKVSRTMNYWQSDYAIAQAAKILGYDEDYTILMERSKQYSVLFDTKTKFFRIPVIDGTTDSTNVNNADISSDKMTTFVSLFDQYAWGGEFTEGGPWQYKFYIPYDPKGLATLYKETLDIDVCDELEFAQTSSSVFHIGTYRTQIHEQIEMIENCWGQYAHNNQPVHGMLYMFSAVDSNGYSGSCAAKGQYYLRKALDTLYHSDVNMYAGDEDNGEMSAWYILSSLGIYSLSPGSSEYVFGSPLFSKVTILLDNNKKLVIETKNNSKENVYVSEIYWNNVLLSPTSSSSVINSISYFNLMEGGTLLFQMTNKNIK